MKGIAWRSRSFTLMIQQGSTYIVSSIRRHSLLGATESGSQRNYPIFFHFSIQIRLRSVSNKEEVQLSM